MLGPLKKQGLHNICSSLYKEEGAFGLGTWRKNQNKKPFRDDPTRKGRGGTVEENMAVTAKAVNGEP